MIKHIVLFKLADKNPGNIEKAVSALEGMKGKIETLKNLEVGVDFLNSERSFDLALTTVFDDKQGLAVYANHPVHLPVKELMVSLCSSSVVVDYKTL